MHLTALPPAAGRARCACSSCSPCVLGVAYPLAVWGSRPGRHRRGRRRRLRTVDASTATVVGSLGSSGSRSTGRELVPAPALGRRRRLRHARRRSASNLGPHATPTCSTASEERAGRGSRRDDGRRRRRRPAGRRHRLRLRPRPAHLPGVRRRSRWRGSPGPAGSTEATVRAAGRRPHEGRTARLHRRAAGQRARAQPRARARSRPDDALADPRRMSAVARGRLQGLPRRRPRRGQDLRHARRGPAPASSAAPTWSSASSRPTAARTPRRRSAGLEVVPRRRRPTAGPPSTEMDLDAVLARRPEVALVDELAHTNVPGSAPRQALAGRRGAARRRDRRDHHRQHPAPRVAQRRRRARSPASSSARPCPTRWSARADQIELVDMSPEALRRRMAHGNIYTAGARSTPRWRNYFRVGNLTALRELALLWLADRVDEGARPATAREHGIEQHLAGPRAGRRRADRRRRGRDAAPPRRAGIAGRGRRASCSPCTSSRTDGLAGAPPDAARPAAGRWSRASAARFHTVVGEDVAERAPRLRPRRQRHPDRRRRQPARPAGSSSSRRGVGDRRSSRLRRHRRPPRHPRAGGARRSLAAGPRRCRAAGRRRAGGLATSGRWSSLAVLLRSCATLGVADPQQRCCCSSSRSPCGVALVGGLWPALVGAGRRVPAAQLVLHPAVRDAHHRRAGERAGAGGVRRGRGRRRLGRRPRRAPDRARPRARRAEAATLATLAGSVLSGATTAVGRCSTGCARPSACTSVALLERHEHRRGLAVVASSGRPPCVRSPAPGTAR